jgi:hypothetical protein
MPKSRPARGFSRATAPHPTDSGWETKMEIGQGLLLMWTLLMVLLIGAGTIEYPHGGIHWRTVRMIKIVGSVLAALLIVSIVA